jgi:hypothetical protein
MGRLPKRLVLTPEDTVDGTSVQWESAEQYSLSAPIIQVSCSDLISDEKMGTLKEVFKQWVQIDRENCDLVRKGAPALPYAPLLSHKRSSSGQHR